MEGKTTTIFFRNAVRFTAGYGAPVFYHPINRQIKKKRLVLLIEFQGSANACQQTTLA